MLNVSNQQAQVISNELRKVVEDYRLAVKTMKDMIRAEKKTLRENKVKLKYAQEESDRLRCTGDALIHELQKVEHYANRVKQWESTLAFDEYALKTLEARSVDSMKLKVIPVNYCGLCFDMKLVQTIHKKLKGFHINFVEVSSNGTLAIDYGIEGSGGRFEINQLPNVYKDNLKFIPTAYLEKEWYK
jgi:hypothetical protein